MKKIILFVGALFFAFNAFATIHDIATSGVTYVPATVNAMVGDTVMFTIPSNHPTQEVSEASWNANNSAELVGGFGTFSSDFMLILTDDMMPVVYYVCVNHIGSGMKGLINVAAAPADSDTDGVNDDEDNCPTISNADQADMDEDMIGDLCDEDIDGDGVNNESDDFPTDASETVDTDNDGTGNNADDDDDDDGCLDVDEIEFGTDPLVADCNVSVDELSTLNGISVYPNPVSDVLTVEVNTNNSLVTYSIFDLSGKLVNQMQNSGSFTLDVSSLENGMYSLEISDKLGNTTTKRLVKK